MYGLTKNGSVLIAFFAAAFRASRPLIQAMNHALVAMSNQQPAGVLALAKLQRKQKQPQPQSR